MCVGGGCHSLPPPAAAGGFLRKRTRSKSAISTASGGNSAAPGDGVGGIKIRGLNPPRPNVGCGPPIKFQGLKKSGGPRGGSSPHIPLATLCRRVPRRRFFLRRFIFGGVLGVAPPPGRLHGAQPCWGQTSRRALSPRPSAPATCVPSPKILQI